MLLAGIAVAATAVAFWQLRIVAPVRMPQDVQFWNGDLYNIYYPGFVFAYRSGQFLPRWNPFQLAGTPFLAGYNGGFLYPPNWLAAVVPIHLALGWLCALHLAFAGVMTLAAARVLGLSWSAAAVASLTFMLSGRLAGEAAWPSYLNAHTWVPAVVLAAGLLARAPSEWRGAVLGVTLAMQFLTGIAQHACYEAYLLALAGAVAWITRPHFDPVWLRRFAIGLGTAGATVVGLAAVQLLPTLEVVAVAGRGGGMPLEHAGAAESAFGELRGIAVASSPIFGLFALGIAAGRRPWIAAAGVTVVVALLFAIGSPVFTWAFVTLPGIDLFRLPHRIVPMVTFPFALVAGFGLDVARRRWSSLVRRVLAAVAVTACGALVLAATPQRWPGALLLATIVAVLVAPSRRVRHAAAWAVVAALGIERFAATRNNVMLTQNNDAAYFAPPPFVDVLRREAGHDRVIVIKDWKRRYPHMEKAGEAWGLHVAQDYSPLVALDYHAFYQPLSHASAGEFFTGRVRPSPPDIGWRMLDLMAVRWVVVAPAVKWAPVPPRFRLAHTGPDATIYENLRGVPRAYLARTVRRVADRTAALNAVQSGGFDPWAEVILEGATPEVASPAIGEVRILSETNDEVVLRADTPTGGVLVLTDLHWPDWHATVDAAPVEILRANYLFRAVRLAPGSHEVRFRYAAWRFRIGSVISLATLCALGVLWWRTRAPNDDAAAHCTGQLAVP